MTRHRDPGEILAAWKSATGRAAANYTTGIVGSFAWLTGEEEYELHREAYAEGSIDLEEFTARIVTMLRERFR